MGALEIKEELQQFIEKSDDIAIMKFYEIVKDYIAQSKKDVSTMTIEQLNSRIDKSEDDFKNGKMINSETLLSKYI